MAYRLQNRLRHASDRFKQNNKLDAVYIGVRAGIEYTFPTEVSPILMSSDETTPGDPSVTRVEYQDFAIDRVNLKNLYPPEISDKIRLTRNDEEFEAVAIGSNEPCYQHITSDRDRVLIHTLRKARGFALE